MKKLLTIALAASLTLALSVNSFALGNYVLAEDAGSILFLQQLKELRMLPYDPGKIRLCNEIQHTEPGIVKLLRLDHIPELHLVRGPEPDSVHLRIHAVELFRFETLLLNEGL